MSTSYYQGPAGGPAGPNWWEQNVDLSISPIAGVDGIDVKAGNFGLELKSTVMQMGQIIGSDIALWVINALNFLWFFSTATSSAAWLAQSDEIQGHVDAVGGNSSVYDQLANSIATAVTDNAGLLSGITVGATQLDLISGDGVGSVDMQIDALSFGVNNTRAGDLSRIILGSVNATISVEPATGEVSTLFLQPLSASLTADDGLGNFSSISISKDGFFSKAFNGVNQFNISNGGDIQTNQVQTVAATARTLTYTKRIAIVDTSNVFQGWIALEP